MLIEASIQIAFDLASTEAETQTNFVPILIEEEVQINSPPTFVEAKTQTNSPHVLIKRGTQTYIVPPYTPLIVDAIIRVLNKTMAEDKKTITRYRREVVPQTKYQKLLQRFEALAKTKDET